MKYRIWKNAAGLALAAALALPAQAQTQDPATTYSNGKVLLQQQKYDMAMAELRPLTDGDGAYAPVASYLYALAALKSNKPDEAAAMLQQLQNQHSNWEGIPEADYLLANVLFEQGEYERALSKLQELQGSPLATDAEGLKRYYLTRLTDRAKYEQLLRRFESDKTVAQVFADKLLNGWYRPQDRQTLERLVQQHNLDRNRYLSKNALKNIGFEVAALLPFQLEQDYALTARKSQFVTDMYAGMKMAQDTLRKQGINVQLYAYDTSADTMSVKRVFERPELSQMDLIIGPIYKSAAKVAARYAEKNDINLINPLSQSLDMAQGYNNVLLFESSIATQARQAATYAYENFSPKSAVILFENAKDDTTFAFHYRQQFLKLGGKVKAYKKFNPQQASATSALFRGLNLQDVGHMAVFSDKMTAAVNATSLLQSQAQELPLITYDDWLDINQISLSQLDNLEVYFVSPKYINKQTPANAWFQKAYSDKYNLPPSQYAYTGFEMLYYFGQLLQAYGPQFSQQLMAQGAQPGLVFPGISYTNANQRTQLQPDNQYVPITKLENLQLSVVNPIY